MAETRSTGALRALADEAGIIAGYHDQTGNEWREASDETRRAILAAMGFDASTDDAAARSLARLRAERNERPLDPVRVVKQDDPAHRRVTVALAEPQDAPIRWELALVTEQGEHHELSGEAPHGAGHQLAIDLPAALPLGYHTLRVALEAARGPVAAEQLLIVVPSSCVRPEEVLLGRKSWGTVVNLYTLRSDRNWGIGDTGDLADVVDWVAELGGQFVGLNPLHALRNTGLDVSPYSPVSRLFRNPVYVSVDAIPEAATAPGVHAMLDSRELRDELAELRRADVIDYERVMRLKWPVLRACYDAAAVREETDRMREFRAWAAEREPELTGFARFMAREAGGFTTEASPAYDDPAAADVDFHRWVQWELERQLGEVAQRAAAKGMRIGLYQDLAIGSSATGSDAESFGGLFVRGMSVGAPPDPYSAHGQNWGFPPIDPHRLREQRYRYFIDLVQAGFRHAGALRIDHVMGLFRLFWIPEGKSGEHGAYVRFPSEDLLGILALESVRNRALVVGEDLGTVPPDVPPAMEQWGVMSSDVLYFERGDHGSFKHGSTYAPNSLATANTHDMATIKGFMLNRDVELRIQHRLVEPGGEDRARSERDNDKRQLIERLMQDGFIDAMHAGDMTRLRAAVHDFLADTPAWLVGVSLDDLAGEVESVNLPGVGPDRYPAWQRRMTRTIAELREDPDVAAALGTRLAQGRP